MAQPAIGSSNNGPASGRREPPVLPKCLLLLRVIAANNIHECSRQDTFHEAEEEALSEETTPRRDCGREHGNYSPENYQYSKDSPDLESLQYESHRVEASEHAKVED